MGKANDSMPGPGNYNSDLKQNTVAYKFGGKYKEKNYDGPGPGQYEMNHTKKGGVKIGTSQRSTLYANKSVVDLPGPGNYDSSKGFGKGSVAVSIRGKQSDLKRLQSPGPGAYELEGTTKVKDRIKTVRIGTSKRVDIVSNTTRDMPGPGNYTSDDRFGKDVKSFKFEGKYSEKHNNNPGPGEYDRRDLLTKATAQSQRFGQSKRETIITKTSIDMPGPGNYDHADSKGFGKSGISVTLRGKAKDTQRLHSPGPGAYDLEGNAKIRERVQTVKIGTSKRTDIVS